MRHFPRALLIVGLLLCLPSSADAHSSFAGSNHFANGLLHPVITSRHLLLIFAFGLWLGQRNPVALRVPLSAWTLALAVALPLTVWWTAPFALEPILAGLICLGGILVAADARVPGLIQGAVFAAAGLALGLDSGPDDPAQAGIAATLLGTFVSALILLLNVAYYSSVLPPKPWLKIGVRIVGSWIAAIAFLLLAFALRPR